MEIIDRLKRMRNATCANIGMMAGSVFAFAITGNEVYVAEAVHDLADSGAHGSRYLAEKHGFDQETEKFQTFLKIGMISVAGLSAITACKLGVNIIEGNFPNDSLQDTLINLAGASLIGLGNTYAYNQVNGIENHSHASSTSLDHAEVDMIASWGLAGSIALEASGLHGASQWGGYAFATYTALHLYSHATTPHKH